jgi:hypothetical protein
MQVQSVTDQANNVLRLDMGDGETVAFNMGCGIVVVDQLDAFTQKLQRVVLTKADLERMLSWLD